MYGVLAADKLAQAASSRNRPNIVTPPSLGSSPQGSSRCVTYLAILDMSEYLGEVFFVFIFFLGVISRSCMQLLDFERRVMRFPNNY
jgi:hypothetical protein